MPSIHRLLPPESSVLPRHTRPAVPEAIATPAHPATDQAALDLPPAPAQPPPIQAFFTQVESGRPQDALDNPDNPDKPLLALIDSARTSLDIAAFELDADGVAEAILAAHQRQVHVRVVTDSDYLHEPALQRLMQAGIPVVDDRRHGLMHNKFLVVDAGTPDAAVWTGSTNLTRNCLYKNNNNALLIRSPELAENFRSEFNEMFEQQRFGIHSPTVVPHPRVTVGKVAIETHFAAEGRVAGKVSEALNQARESIHFLAFSFTHDAIGQVVAQKWAQGVQVSGVFEKTGANTPHSEYGPLKARGADVYTDRNPAVMHHKVFIIDGRTVITGSFNFSESADRNNDENLLIIESEALAQQYEQEFQKILKQSRGEP